MNALRRLGAAGSSPQGLSSRPAIGTSVHVPFISGCPENSWNQKCFVVTHNVLNISRIVIRGVSILAPPQVFILLNFRGLRVTGSGGGPSESAEYFGNQYVARHLKYEWLAIGIV